MAAPSSPSPSSSPIHKASLIDASLHSPVLLELLDIKLTKPVIEYAIDLVIETVDYAMGRPGSSSRSPAPRRENKAFDTFVNNVITRAEITTSVLLASLVYIDRAKPHLHIALEEWALERVFLGALIVASKYLNDSTLKNVHWALCTGVFGKRDVGRIEREFLDVLDFQLGIAEDDILSHHAGLSAVAFPDRRTAPACSRNKPVVPPEYIYIPDVESSSSSSSDESAPSSPLWLADASPRSSSSTSVSSVSSAAASPLQCKTDASTAPPPRPQKPSFRLSSTTLDLLRAFPVPMHHQHAARRQELKKDRNHCRTMPAVPPPPVFA